MSQMMDAEERIRAFEHELTALINRYSLENRSNTPDYILAKYLVMTLICVEHAIGVREAWYGGPRAASERPRDVT